MTPEQLAIALQRTVTALDQFNELTIALGISLQEINVSLNAPPAQAYAAPQPPPGFAPPPAPPGFTAPLAPPAFQQPPAPPAGLPAAAAPDAKRKRRTKAEIAADEAAAAAGLPLPSTAGNMGGSGAPNAPTGFAPPQAPLSPPAMAPAPAPLQPMQPVQPLNVPPGEYSPTVDDVNAKAMEVITLVESVWPGHGAGQVGALLQAKINKPNIHGLAPQELKNFHQWLVYFAQKFQAQELPQGVATPGF